jgi:RecB family endonuclease NucS
VDLLVDDGDRLTAVEYKTGTPGDLPAPAHVEQLSRYLRLLNEASGLPVRGVLVYLDRRQLIPLDNADAHGASHV